MKKRVIFCAMLICLTAHHAHAAREKIAVLITGWGMPVGYNFDYAWTTSDYPRIGDRTETENQACKIGHVGQFPYKSHINMIPWAITYPTPGYETAYDSYGIYIYDNSTDTFISPNPDIDPVDNATLSDNVTRTPLRLVMDQNGVLSYPLDPRDGTDHLAGWYRLGDYKRPWPNGASDLVEGGPPLYMWLSGIMGTPTQGDAASAPPAATASQDAHLKTLMQQAYGDRVDMRFGYYTAMAGAATPEQYQTKLEDDVAEEFAGEGFRKMIIARETTDHNRYANEFMSGNYVKERLCELGVLDEMEIYQSRQVGRTPEFNALNIKNLKPFIEKYPEGSTIAMVYVTRGLTWGKAETSGAFGAAHPWSKEVYHENAYLNYLSWKKALQKEFGSRYHLVFTKNDIASDNRTDNFYSYGLSTDVDLKGYSNEGYAKVYNGTRDAIDLAKQSGYDKIIVAPCHWNFDNLDTAIRMKQLAKLPLAPRADMMAGNYEHTSCEAAAAGEVDCGSDNATAEITVAPSYSKLPQEFSTAYFVMLRGALERFGLYPAGEKLVRAAARRVSKLKGGRVFAFNPLSPVFRSQVTIPPDPYPAQPDAFTPDNATAVNNPDNTNDCLWEDTKITIAWRRNPPAMQAGVKAVGPAVLFGPYRTVFNRDVTVKIPYRRILAQGKEIQPYIYNHVTGKWDAIDAVDAGGGMVTFKTNVLGLFRAGIAE